MTSDEQVELANQVALGVQDVIIKAAGDNGERLEFAHKSAYGLLALLIYRMDGIEELKRLNQVCYEASKDADELLDVVPGEGQCH